MKLVFPEEFGPITKIFIFFFLADVTDTADSILQILKLVVVQPVRQ